MPSFDKQCSSLPGKTVLKMAGHSLGRAVPAVPVCLRIGAFMSVAVVMILVLVPQSVKSRAPIEG